MKKRFCNECNGKILYTKCNNQINENKEFEDHLILWNRVVPNEFGHMLPYYKEEDDLFVIKYLNKSSIFVSFFFENLFIFQ